MGLRGRTDALVSNAVALPQQALEDGDVQLPYVYRVSKYDPADRDDHGHYTGIEDTSAITARSRRPIGMPKVNTADR